MFDLTRELFDKMIPRFSTRPSGFWRLLSSRQRMLNCLKTKDLSVFILRSSASNDDSSDCCIMARGRSPLSNHQFMTKFIEEDGTGTSGSMYIKNLSHQICCHGDRGEEKNTSSSKYIRNCFKEKICIDSHTRTHLTNSSQLPKFHQVMNVINSDFVTNFNMFKPFRSTQIASCGHQCVRSVASKVSRQGKGKKKQRALDDTDSDDDDDDIVRRGGDDLERDWDPEIDEAVEAEEEEVEEEEGVTKDWKDIKQHVPSLRVDAVLSAGLGVSRKKIEEAYLSMRLRMNGEKVAKKSSQVKEGDILDLILERSTPSQAKEGEVSNEGMSVMRLHIREISTDRTGKDRVPVLLRRWKNLKITKEKK